MTAETGSFTIGAVLPNAEIVRRMRDVMTRREWSAREWARQAKLKEETHVSRILTRLTKSPKARVETNTMAALARAADLPLDELIGHDSARVTPDRDYPSRAQGIRAARLVGYSEAAIDAVLQVDDLPSDPGTEYWFDLARAKHRELALKDPSPKPPHRRKRR